MRITLPGRTLFNPPEPAASTAPPPIPTREDPEVAAAAEKLRQSELRRKGRAASILTSAKGAGEELGGGTTIERPRAARLLGE